MRITCGSRVRIGTSDFGPPSGRVRLRSGDPFFFAVGEDLALPDREPGLDLFDQLTAGVEGLASVRGTDRSSQCDITDPEQADPVRDRNRVHLGHRGYLPRDLGHEFLGGGVSDVLELGDPAPVVMVANDTPEGDDRSGA